jgi:hypothetical protein
MSILTISFKNSGKVFLNKNPSIKLLPEDDK